MPYKFDENGNVVTQQVGNVKLPVFIYSDGKESPLDGDSTVATIGRLNGEAKAQREAKEALEGRLKAFDGIEDGEAARTALQTVKNLKDGDLVTAGKVQEIRDAAKRAAEDQVADANKKFATELGSYKQKAETLEQQLYSEKIGGAFTRSKFISEKVAIPADMVQARFGNAFRVEDGKIVAYDQSGNKIFSRARPGDIADVDEALETLVDAYPYRDSILKGSGASGGGASNSQGSGGKRTITRAQYDAMDSGAQRAAALEVGQGKAALVD